MQLSNLSFALLHTLDVLLETRNLSHAALRLNSSQPVLSRQLAQLRQDFDDPLLVRHGREYVLTPRAEALIGPLKHLLAEMEALLSPASFSPERCDRRFELAASDYIADHMLPLLMQRLASSAPHASIRYHTWQARQFDLLASGGLDLITTMLDDVPDELHGKLLGEDRPVCVMQAQHPLSACRSLSEADYLAWPHVRISGGGDKDSFIDHYLSQRRQRRTLQLEVPFYTAALRVVSDSRLLVTLPEHIAASLAQVYPITWRPLGFITHTHRYWVLWHTRTHHDPAHQWFRNQVHELWQDSRFGVSNYHSGN
ncbi:LysR family transcriptional regulator [Vogesella sp. LIG4]|uniref:LysR family transcriptional regulator n=1 Tax=Vogesella sp. LIG4 TaxID=1192162 RepID=UPI00082011DF|nr:LysR family transcriptional regulator [Vogesella sp. LIG4]SCK25490.1 DNA-binding transcriptional regulator, LysR family [Vogesella sp. LIG4]